MKVFFSKLITFTQINDYTIHLHPFSVKQTFIDHIIQPKGLL